MKMNLKNIIRNQINDHTYARLLGYGYRLKYEAIGDPLRVYNAKLEDINHMSTYSGGKKFSILDGDWDQERRHFTEAYRYKMFNKHFKQNLDWEETEEFQERAQKIRENEAINTLDIPPEKQSVSELKNYYEFIDSLYDNIKTSGYKPQAELDSSDDYACRDIHPSLNEIQVCIGRDGTILVKSGYHRYIIAKILNLDVVPVRTQIRHSKWQSLRDEIKNASNKASLSKEKKNFLKHPELSDIIPSSWRLNRHTL